MHTIWKGKNIKRGKKRGRTTKKVGGNKANEEPAFPEFKLGMSNRKRQEGYCPD